MMKLIIFFVFCLGSVNVVAQSDYVLNGSIKVEATFNSKDSTLTLRYKNIADVSLMVWVGDFSVSLIVNHNDISGKYLASPIVNEIHIIHKAVKTFKNTNSYFLRNDSNELNLYNYRLLNSEQVLKVNLLLNNDSAYNLVKSGKMYIKGVVSFLSEPLFGLLDKSVDVNLKRDLIEPEKWSRMVQDYTPLLPEYSWYLNSIILKNIPFEFNRPNKNNGMINGRPWNPHYGDLSKVGLIKPVIEVLGKANYISFESLYRFVNKYMFTSKIKIK